MCSSDLFFSIFLENIFRHVIAYFNAPCAMTTNFHGICITICKAVNQMTDVCVKINIEQEIDNFKKFLPRIRCILYEYAFHTRKCIAYVRPIPAKQRASKSTKHVVSSKLLHTELPCNTNTNTNTQAAWLSCQVKRLKGFAYIGMTSIKLAHVCMYLYTLLAWSFFFLLLYFYCT